MRANEIGIDQVAVVEVPQITTEVGDLAVVDGVGPLPFGPKRLFYLYDVPTGEDRGAHAHKELHQFLVCLSGSFDVVADDGVSNSRIHLNRPWIGLHIPPMIWAAEVNFDPGSVCLVMASDIYEESDYIRDYQDFLKLAAEYKL